jgi:hypothetical protein
VLFRAVLRHVSVERLARRGKRRVETRPLTDRDAAIEVMPNRHLEAHTAAAPRLRVDLQRATADSDGVVAGDDARLFVAENPVEIRGAERDEGTRRVTRRPGERGVVLRHETLGKIDIRSLARGDPGHTQLVHETCD